MSDENLKSRPIGVFDSGIGGLTVAAEIMRLLPHEHIVYFGDVGRTPYGVKSKEIITNYTRQDINFLLENKVKVIVAACNSVSAAALETVKEEYEIDILGVITPGAGAAVKSTENNRVGIIGTVATIGSNSYAKQIQSLNSEVKVFSLACPLFVPLAEEGYLDRPATKLIAEDYLKTLIDVEIDTLVLGCTHYPLLKNIIGEVMGPKVRLIDSAESTALELVELLKRKDLLNPDRSEAEHKFYVSDVPERFSQIVTQFLGKSIKNVTRVDITRY